MVFIQVLCFWQKLEYVYSFFNIIIDIIIIRKRIIIFLFLIKRKICNKIKIPVRLVGCTRKIYNLQEKSISNYQNSCNYDKNNNSFSNNKIIGKRFSFSDNIEK